MALLITIITFFFVAASFLIEIPKSSSNSIISFLSTEAILVASNLLLFTLGYLVLIFIHALTRQYDNKINFRKKLKRSFLIITQVIVLSFFLSYIFLYIIAILQLNITSIFVNVNPNAIGMKMDTAEIVNTLKLNSISPKILFNDNENQGISTAIAQANTGYNNFYGKLVLTSIPNFIVIPSKNEKIPFILIDRTLIFSKVNFKELEMISPILGHLFVKEYFGNKFVKFYPKVNIMDRNEYQAYRIKESEKKIIKIDENLKDIAYHLSTISAAINNDTKEIEKVKSATLSATIEDATSQYNRCIKYYKIDECQKIKSQISKKETKKENPELIEWQKQLEFDKSLYRAYTAYEKLYKAQRAGLVKSKIVVSDEHGIFEPENLIKAKIEKIDKRSLTDFFTVLIHEYFHYASFNKEKKFSNPFFEEALTEYFARQVIEHNLQVKTNLGYPIQAKIISQISKRIAENELISIYFSKDDIIFGDALDRVYGDGFYEKNKNIFQAMQYSTNPNQLVDLANQIMTQIDGEKINVKDYYSTETKIEDNE